MYYLLIVDIDIKKIEYGYCACGCGQKTKLYKAGLSEGEPMPYIRGHQPLEIKDIELLRFNRLINKG